MTYASSSILLVDDNEGQRYAMARCLRVSGHKVTEARDGATGLRLAQEAPSLILLDLNLPDMHGFDVCRRLKQDPHTKDIPVVFISATWNPGDAHSMAEGLGAASFLIQPVEPDQLLAVVAGVVARNRSSAG